MSRAYAIYKPEARGDEPNGEVIFATTETDALEQYCISWFGGSGEEFTEGVVVQRVPAMDKYLAAQNTIPKSEYLKIRWQVECDGCGFTDDDHELLGDKVFCQDCYDFERLPTQDKEQ
ncbi:MAG: hypothetical protein DHS20C08_04250 [Rhodomicrobium sp.]|nr:MAG: hypothetical protein DHS20C08_04250 [Rhodomicrobium sp.]